MKGNWRVRILAVLLAVTAIGAAWAGIERYQKAHRKTEAEIISLYPDTRGVLAAQLPEGALFTFSWPERDAGLFDPGQIGPGTLLELTSPDYWLYSSPMQLPGVSAVKVTGQRGDFVALHYDTLCASYAQGGAAQLEAAVNALDQLNAGEKNGLLYLIRGMA